MDTMIKDMMSAYKPGITIAGTGLKKMEQCKENKREARVTGDFFLKTIASKGAADEKALAATALKAAAVEKLYDIKAVQIQTAVLSAIAAGGIEIFRRHLFFMQR